MTTTSFLVDVPPTAAFVVLRLVPGEAECFADLPKDPHKIAVLMPLS